MDLRHSQMILHLFYISLTNIVGIVKRKKSFSDHPTSDVYLSANFPVCFGVHF